MSDDFTKPEIAAGFEAMAAPVIAARGPSPIRPGKGRVRMLKTEAGQVVTHGRVVEGAARAAGVPVVVEDGRPPFVSCACGNVIKVAPRGTLPKLCADCRHVVKREQGKASSAKFNEAHRDAKRLHDRNYKLRRAADLDDGLALPVFE